MELCPESKARSPSSHASRVFMGALVLLLTSLLSGRALAQEEAPREGEGAIPSGPGTGVVRPPEGPSAGPKIVHPKIVKFVNAEYPKEAHEKGLEGSVVLALDIDKTGKVTKAEIAQGLGYGFDEAAQQAAMQFEFEPATRDGTPFAARIHYRYDFKLTVAEKPPEKTAPPTVGNLGGTVLISGIEVPLAAAQVVVTGTDGVPHQTTTDGQGKCKWSVEGLPSGKYKVRVTSAGGFVPLDGAEDVVAGEATDVKYRLAFEKTKGIEVTVEGERPQREVTRRTLERREMERIPGTSGDALRAIQALPGVARPPGLAGLLIVRGAAPQDTAYFVDGTTVPLIYHFGGLRSTIPTELLDKIDFYPGNYSAKYGQYMGGLVDISLREPNTRCKGDYGKPTDKYGCFHGLLQADLIDGRLLLQGPIGRHWKFAVGGRRSWLDAWLGPVLEEAGAGVTTAPVFYDYQAIADTKPSRNSKLSLRFYGSDDRLKALLSNPAAQEPLLGGSANFGVSFYRAQAFYQTDLSRTVDLYAMAAVGKNAVDASLGPIVFNVNLFSIQTRSELGFKIARGFKLNVGMDFLVAPYSLLIRAPPPPRPGEPFPGPFVSRPLQVTQEEATAFRPAWYTEAELKPTRRSLIVPGFRVDYARDTGNMDLSPRLNGRYDLVGGRAEEALPTEERHLRTTLKGGVGVFAQPPQFQETNVIFGTPGLRSNRAIHYSIGIEQEFTRNIELSVEGFYKDLTNLVARRAGPGATYVYDNAGTGRIIGLETLLKYKADPRFFGWLTYTLMRSVRRDHPDEPEYLFQFDQTHILQVLGSYRLGRGWEFGARFQLISGPLITPVPRAPDLTAIYAADAGSYTPLPGVPFSERLPLFHRLDIRVDKGWQFKEWRLSAYLEVINAYNHPAREAIAYNYNFTRQAYLTGLPILPSIGVRGEF
jgi:TonB family protein